MLPRALGQQVHHMEWADARLWEAALALPAAHADPRTHELLHHVHLVQRLYLQVWRGEPLTFSEASDFADLRAVLGWARGFYAPARAYLDSLGEEELRRSITFPWADRMPGRTGTIHPATMEESLIQIVLHGAHHRAELCTRLRELGGTPPLVDFITWVWRGGPDAEWPAP